MSCDTGGPKKEEHQQRATSFRDEMVPAMKEMIEPDCDALRLEGTLTLMPTDVVHQLNDDAAFPPTFVHHEIGPPYPSPSCENFPTPQSLISRRDHEIMSLL